MSGAEVFAVIGIIANILGLIDLSVDVYTRAEGFSHDVNEIPQAFRHISQALPLVKSALQETEKRIKEGEISEEACQALRKVLDGCEVTVTKLKDIFCDVLPAKDASKWTRGWKAISSKGQDKKVEALDKTLMRFVEVLTLYHSSRGLSTAQFTQAFSKLAVKLEEPTRKPLFMVRYQTEKECFIGREDLMLEIAKRFEEKAPRVAISGIGGVGKSRIAIEYCYLYRNQSPNSNVFWVHGGTKSRLVAAYYEIAEKIKIPDFDKPNANILTLVSDWLSEEENGSWLMVLDNADDSDLWIVSPEGPLINYLPRGGHGSILITTRNSQLGKTLSNSRKKPINVAIFSLDDSIALLRSKVSEEDEVTNEGSREIVEILGHLPLAITQAAAYLDQNEISVDEYLNLLKSSKADTVDLLVRGSHDGSRDTEIQNSVFHTWKISFDQISRENPRAASVLSLMALLDRQAIQVDLLRNREEGDLEIREAMQKLKAFSLINEESKDKTFSMHRIVNLSIQWYLKSQGTLNMWQEKALDCLETHLPQNLDIKSIEILHPHIELVASYTYSTNACKLQHANILKFLGAYYHHVCKWQVAIQQYSECLKLRESILDPGNELIVDVMIDLASCFIFVSSQDNFSRAETLINDALDLSRKEFPDLYYRSSTERARLLIAQGKMQQADEVLRQIFRFVIDRYGSESGPAANIMGNFTYCYEPQGRYEAAGSFLRKAFRISKTLGRSSFQHGRIMGILAQNLELQYNYSEALLFRRESLSLYIDLLGPSHGETLRIRNLLAQCLVYNKEYTEAEYIARETLRLGNSNDDRPALDARNLLAKSLSLLNQSDEAIVAYTENLRLIIEKYGFGGSYAIKTRLGLAQILAKSGNLTKAEQLRKENTSLLIKPVGTVNDFWSVRKQDLVPHFLHMNGDFKKAVELCKEKIRNARNLEDGRPIRVIWSIRGLAFEMQDNGQPAELVENLYREFIILCTKVIGARHPATIRTISFLARHLERQDRLQEAETFYQELVEMEMQLFRTGSEQFDIFNPIHNPDMLDVETAIDDMTAYAQVLTKTEKHDEAARYSSIAAELQCLEYINILNDANRLRTLVQARKRFDDDSESLVQEMIRLRKQVLGSDHRDTLAAMKYLGSLLVCRQKLEQAEAIYREVLRIKTQVLGPDHSDTLRVMNDLGSVLLSQKNFEAAEMTFQEILNTSIRVLGSNHEDTLKAMSCLATVLNFQQKFEESEAIFRDIINNRTIALGPNHEHVRLEMWSLGEILVSWKKFDEGEKMLRDVLEIEVQTLGADHETVFVIMIRLANQLILMERYEKAEEVQRDAFVQCAKVLGPDHDTTIECMFGLGKILLHVGKVDEARELLDRTLKLCVQNFGPDDLRTLDVKKALDDSYSRSSPKVISEASKPGL